MGRKNNDFDKRNETIKKRKKLKRILRLIFLYVVMIAVCVSGIFISVVLYDRFKSPSSVPDYSVTENQSDTVDSASNPSGNLDGLTNVQLPEGVEVDIIPVGSARPSLKLEGIGGIVIHNVGTPGQTAEEHLEYLKSPETESSSHFIIGLNGEIIQCLPLDEQAIASGKRNVDTISIEVCHTSADGLFNQKAYASLVELTASILKGTNLTADDVLRHYDVTGADCPPHYINSVDEWNKFKSDVAEKLK